MNTYKGTLYIHAGADFEGNLNTFNCDMSKCGFVLLGTHDYEVEYSMPDKDPVEAEIEGLEKMVAEIETEAYAKTEKLKERISQLTCIEFKPEAE